MVTYDKNEKDLVIPSALGIAGMQDSVCGVTEQEVIEIVESAITDYDTEIQVDLEDIRENVSGNTNDIAALSAATEVLEQRVDDISTSALTEQIEALSGSVGDIRSDVETLSGISENIISDVETLSGATVALSASTSANAESIAAVSGATTALTENLNALSGRTSAITEQVTELSGVTSGLSADVAALSGVTEGIATSVGGLSTGLEALSAATSGIAVDVETLSAITNGIISSGDVVYDYYEIYGSTSAQKQAIWSEIGSYKNTRRKVWMRKQDASQVLWFLCYYFDAPYIYFVSNDNYRIYQVLFHQNGSLSINQKDILPTSSNSTKGGIKTGSGVTMSGDFLSVKYGDGLGMSGDTLVVSGGTGGGGIEKVSTLPLTAEEGDVVWLEGHTQSGYTITMDMSEKSFESGYQMAEINGNGYECEAGANYGIWRYSAEYGATLRSRRNGSTRYLDIITDNTVSLGQDADSMQTGVEFPFLGKFYAYEGGMWHNIAREVYVDFDKEPNKVKEYFLEIYSGLTDFDGSDLVIFYRQDSDVRTYAAFKPYFSAHYGIDCQSNDSRGARDSSWGQIRVDMNRLSYDWEQDSISFNTLVGTKWSATEDQLSGTMCLYVDPSGDFGHRDVNCLFDEASQHQLAVKGCELDFSVEYGFGSVVYARKYNISDDYWYYTWSLIVPTDTDVKKGVWHCDEANGGSMGDISTYVLDSWTTL